VIAAYILGHPVDNDGGGGEVGTAELGLVPAVDEYRRARCSQVLLPDISHLPHCLAQQNFVQWNVHAEAQRNFDERHLAVGSGNVVRLFQIVVDTQKMGEEGVCGSRCRLVSDVHRTDQPTVVTRVLQYRQRHGDRQKIYKRRIALRAIWLLSGSLKVGSLHKGKQPL